MLSVASFQSNTTSFASLLVALLACQVLLRVCMRERCRKQAALASQPRSQLLNSSHADAGMKTAAGCQGKARSVGYDMIWRSQKANCQLETGAWVGDKDTWDRARQTRDGHASAKQAAQGASLVRHAPEGEEQSIALDASKAGAQDSHPLNNAPQRPLTQHIQCCCLLPWALPVPETAQVMLIQALKSQLP